MKGSNEKEKKKSGYLENGDEDEDDANSIRDAKKGNHEKQLKKTKSGEISNTIDGIYLYYK